MCPCAYTRAAFGFACNPRICIGNSPSSIDLFLPSRYILKLHRALSIRKKRLSSARPSPFAPAKRSPGVDLWIDGAQSSVLHSRVPASPAKLFSERERAVHARVSYPGCIYWLCRQGTSPLLYVLRRQVARCTLHVARCIGCVSRCPGASGAVARALHCAPCRCSQGVALFLSFSPIRIGEAPIPPA